MDLSRKWVVSRKEHKCIGCSRVIVKGVRIQSIEGKENGSFYHYYWCAICQSAWEKAGMDYPDEITEGDMLQLDEWHEVYDARPWAHGPSDPTYERRTVEL